MEKDVLVQDWMTPDPVTIAEDTPVLEAHKIMMEFNIRRLPIMAGNRLVGIVTRGDVRGAQASEATSLNVWELNYLLSRLKVKSIMSAPVKVAAPEMTVREAARIMLENKIAGLPVMANERLVGIITESDIFRMLVETWEVDERIGAAT